MTSSLGLADVAIGRPPRRPSDQFVDEAARCDRNLFDHRVFLRVELTGHAATNA
jgi:hypothetical protein